MPDVLRNFSGLAGSPDHTAASRITGPFLRDDTTALALSANRAPCEDPDCRAKLLSPSPRLQLTSSTLLQLTVCTRLRSSVKSEILRQGSNLT